VPWRLLAASLVLSGVLLAPGPVEAEPQEPARPEPPSLTLDPGSWASWVFTHALSGMAKDSSSDVVGFMDWLLGNGNVISQTPDKLSYDNDTVKRLSGTMRTVANAALAVITVWGGLNIMLHPHIRAPYHGVLELVPRLLLEGLLVNTSLGWGTFVIKVNNALCQALGSAPIPAWSAVLHFNSAGSTLVLDLVAVYIYLIMGLLLLGQMLMRLALVDALLILAPLALLCWVLPQTEMWARLWSTTFFGTVFVQFIQVLVLQLGVELLQNLHEVLPKPLGSPDDGRVWLVQLLLGVSVLQLARKVPRLMPGYLGSVGAWSPVSVIGRQLITTLARSGRGRA
jgi:hypothetical protein